jgi:DNA-directed RNA polymerase specialized sigma24 family protein
MKSTITRAKAGDARAKEALVSHLASRVTSCSRYYARRCGVDADDLQQEMWLGVFAALERVDVTIGDPSQYLLAQGRYALLTSLRARRAPGMPIEAAEGVADQGCLEASVIGGQTADAFVSSLQGQASTIVSYLMAGHSRSDAARILGCTPANITYHLRRVETDLAAALAVGGSRLAFAVEH